MYYYIYDSYLKHPKYNKILSKIENRLIDLELKGNIIKLLILKNLKEVINDVIKQGASTIVICGNDQTFNQAINCLKSFDITIGFIPITLSSKIAKLLGIPLFETACNVLAGRITKKIDLGKINNQYFFSSLKIFDVNDIECDNQYHLFFRKKQIFYIYNLGSLDFSRKNNPYDGLLEIIVPSRNILKVISKFFLKFFKKENKIDSFFLVKKIKIDLNKKFLLQIDYNDLENINSPVFIEIVPERLKIIVGKERFFD